MLVCIPGGYSGVFKIGVLRLGYEASTQKIISGIKIHPKRSNSLLRVTAQLVGPALPWIQIFPALRFWQQIQWITPPGGLPISDWQGVRHFFGFVKRCLVYLWVRYLVHNWYVLGVADEKLENTS